MEMNEQVRLMLLKNRAELSRLDAKQRQKLELKKKQVHMLEAKIDQVKSQFFTDNPDSYAYKIIEKFKHRRNYLIEKYGIEVPIFLNSRRYAPTFVESSGLRNTPHGSSSVRFTTHEDGSKKSPRHADASLTPEG